MPKLLWPHPLDLSNGMEPSAYGVKLFLNEEGQYIGEMSEERAEVELNRDGKAFVMIEEPIDPVTNHDLPWEGTDNE